MRWTKVTILTILIFCVVKRIIQPIIGAVAALTIVVIVIYRGDILMTAYTFKIIGMVVTHHIPGDTLVVTGLAGDVIIRMIHG